MAFRRSPVRSRSGPFINPLRSFAPCNGRTLTTALDGFTMRLAQHEGLTTRCSGRAYSYRISVRRAHRLPPEGRGPPTATT